MANSDPKKILPFKRTGSKGRELAEARSKDKQSSSRLVVGQHFADIVADPRSDTPYFYWVVQKFGNADVIYWGQELTLQAAEKAAYQFLHEQALSAKQSG